VDARREGASRWRRALAAQVPPSGQPVTKLDESHAGSEKPPLGPASQVACVKTAEWWTTATSAPLLRPGAARYAPRRRTAGRRRAPLSRFIRIALTVSLLGVGTARAERIHIARPIRAAGAGRELLPTAAASALLRSAGTAPACSASSGSVPCQVDMKYYGGPVLSNVKVYDSSWLGWGNQLDAPAESVSYFNVGRVNNLLNALQGRVEELEAQVAEMKAGKK